MVPLSVCVCVCMCVCGPVYEIKFRKIQIVYNLRASTHRRFVAAERLRGFNRLEYFTAT